MKTAHPCCWKLRLQFCLISPLRASNGVKSFKPSYEDWACNRAGFSANPSTSIIDSQELGSHSHAKIEQKPVSSSRLSTPNPRRSGACGTPLHVLCSRQKMTFQKPRKSSNQPHWGRILTYCIWMRISQKIIRLIPKETPLKPNQVDADIIL